MSRETVVTAVNAAEKLNDTLNAFLYIDQNAPQRAEALQAVGRDADRQKILRYRDANLLRLANSWPIIHPTTTVIQRLIDAGASSLANKLRRVCDGLVKREFALDQSKNRGTQPACLVAHQEVPLLPWPLESYAALSSDTGLRSSTCFALRRARVESHYGATRVTDLSPSPLRDQVESLPVEQTTSLACWALSPDAILTMRQLPMYRFPTTRNYWE